MPIPKFDVFMKPTLEILSDGKIHTGQEIEDALIARLHLTEKDLSETVKSGRTRFKSNAQWARTYMKQAGLIISPERGKHQISNLGKEVLEQNPPTI